MPKFPPVRVARGWYLFDDTLEYNFTRPLVPVLRDTHAVEIASIGRRYGLRLETFYSSQHGKFFIFATNGKGFRWIFLVVEDPNKKFRPLDARTLLLVRQIFWYNQNFTNLDAG